jgi:Glycosyl transferase family 8
MTASQKHDCAVAFCVDSNFFDLSLFMVWQIAHLNPHRRFDFVIASQDDLVLPSWAESWNITLHRPGRLPDAAAVARFNGSMSTVFRLMLARELGDRYRRILYLDSDMYVEGGDLNRLVDIDLGSHPVGAARGASSSRVASWHAPEFAKTGHPAMPYANTGLQVIDTRAYVEQDVEARCLSMAGQYPHAIKMGDQSMLNLVFQGKFAWLAPCWNWQLNAFLPLMSHRYPIFIHHFIMKKKPNVDSSGLLPARFNQAYRDFMTQFRLNSLAGLAPPCDPAPLGFGTAARMVLDHVVASRMLRDLIARYPDPYRAIL